jgi:hypothetical protein
MEENPFEIPDTSNEIKNNLKELVDILSEIKDD